MRTLIVLSALVVVALAQYGSVATAADTSAVQVTYQVPQYQYNPYPGNYFYRPRPHRRHGRHHRHRRPDHDWDFDDESSEEDWGWARDDFEGYHGYHGYPYPFQYQQPIYTVQTTSNNAAADSTSYGTVSNTAAAAPATYGSQ
ncbi:unnamed protein product [Caenorhabditis angaria]|uniref:Uncharacterized protein n=1 Tax=Caenorhabditis angaria TaxID=860376 RepID=A0A9P1J422_9PELO|nr:unnamed protein product [Caenorhabditis angaria]